MIKSHKDVQVNLNKVNSLFYLMIFLKINSFFLKKILILKKKKITNTEFKGVDGTVEAS